MFDFKKNRVIKAKIEEYLVVANETLDIFREGMLHYMSH